MNTAKVTDRRTLRFESIDVLLADIDRIVEADKNGTLRRTGNWTAGQAFGHVAAWMDYAYEGYPAKAPWFVKLYMRSKKKSFLRDGLPAGVSIPGVPGGTYGTEEYSTEEGARRLREALERLAREEPRKHESPVFGPISHDEHATLNLRHAELHLGFLHPE